MTKSTEKAASRVTDCFEEVQEAELDQVRRRRNALGLPTGGVEAVLAHREGLRKARDASRELPRESLQGHLSSAGDF